MVYNEEIIYVLEKGGLSRREVTQVLGKPSCKGCGTIAVALGEASPGELAFEVGVWVFSLKDKTGLAFLHQGYAKECIFEVNYSIPRLVTGKHG